MFAAPIFLRGATTSIFWEMVESHYQMSNLTFEATRDVVMVGVIGQLGTAGAFIDSEVV